MKHDVLCYHVRLLRRFKRIDRKGLGSSVAHFTNADLHNHSYASDGTLAPAAMVALAASNGCDAVALTDHDTTAGLSEAASAAAASGLHFVPGVEISVSWKPMHDADAKFTTLHILGLNINPESAPLRAGLTAIRTGRISRGKLIGDALAEAGIEGMFEAAYALAENKDMLGRTHFARVLVERKIAPDVHRAFARFLTPRNPGFVPHQWAALADAVGWIHEAGGTAVIAHPGRYNLTAVDRELLFDEFKAHGGEAIEVVTGSHSKKQFGEYASFARRFGFLASRGADFHDPKESAHAPGTMAPLPSDLSPVWSAWH